MKKSPIVMSLVVVLCGLAVVPAATQAQYLLQEDFDDGVADGFTPQDGFWSVAGGVAVFDGGGYEYFSKNIAGDCAWSDYTFECDIKVDVGQSVNQMVFVRVVDSGNCYEVNVRGEPWNDVHILRWADGVEKDDLYSVPCANVVGVWHHYRIDCWRNEIRVEFDGEELFTYVDNESPYLCGGVALAGYTGSLAGQRVEFDNVVVSTHAVPNMDSSWGEIRSLYR